MSQLVDTNTPLLSGELPQDSQLPEWFKELRVKGWKEFESLPMPKRTDETWRFSNLKSLTLEDFVLTGLPDETTSSEILDASAADGESSPGMVFANGKLLREASPGPEASGRGVVFGSLLDLLGSHEEIIRRHFMVQGAQLGSDKFAALHQALTESGTLLYVPAGVKVSIPFEVYHWVSGENSSVFPHTLLIAEEGSEVTLIDHFRTTDPGKRAFACAVNDLYVGESAKVTYICDQQWSRETLAFQMNSTLVEKNASALSLNLNIGAKYSRVESRSRMNGEESRSDMLAATIADGDQIFDLRTAQDHGARDTTSDLLYKNALSGSSKAIFSGIIKVEKGAHQTDAYQTNRSLMLSDDAESVSMPGLEILADDVKCSHGSTTGSVSEEEMFYMLSRGIPKDIAEELIVVGFLNEVLSRLPNKDLSEKLLSSIDSKFRKIQNR